jgi:5-methylcytosine-specific restriction endonuclease McrA
MKTLAEMEKARVRARVWTAANRERKRATDADYRKREAEHIREYKRAYYEANKAEILEQCRIRYAANPKPTIERSTLWARNNPKKVYAKTNARRIARRDRVIKELRIQQKNRCAYCRVKLGKTVHIDHILPYALGGSNGRSNLQLTCADCNFSKNRRHPIDFAQSLGRLL